MPSNTILSFLTKHPRWVSIAGFVYEAAKEKREQPLTAKVSGTATLTVVFGDEQARE